MHVLWKGIKSIFCFNKIWVTTHIKLTHIGEKPFKCIFCEKVFQHSSFLIQHKLTHIGEKPFKCIFCEKSFKYSSFLTPHKLTHIGQKQFECISCEKAFTWSYILLSHKLIHTGKKLFKYELIQTSEEQNFYWINQKYDVFKKWKFNHTDSINF